MAINPETQYPGKIAPSSADYPYGQARNITTPGDGTGTPWEAALVNDLFGFQQALLSEAGLVPSGTPEKVTASQYLQSLELILPKVTTATAAADIEPVVGKKLIIDGSTWSAVTAGGPFTSNGGGTGAGSIIAYTADNTKAWTRDRKQLYLSDFGVVFDWDDTTKTGTDSTAAFQNAVDYAGPLGIPLYLDSSAKCRLTGTITVPSTSKLALYGEGFGIVESGGAASHIMSGIVFDSAVAATTLDQLFVGNNLGIDWRHISIEAKDDQQRRDFLALGTLGVGAVGQNSGDPQLNIVGCSFLNTSGSCLLLGGETYGSIRDCQFSRVAQAAAINANGEIIINDLHIVLGIAHPNFSPGAGNKDALFYIYDTRVEISDITGAMGVVERPTFYFEEQRGLSFDKIKWEYPGITSLTHDFLKIENNTTPLARTTIENIDFVASHTTADGGGRFLKTYGTNGLIYLMSVRDLQLTYGVTSPTGMPYIDFTGGSLPRQFSFDNCYRFWAGFPLVTYPENGAMSTVKTNAYLDGLGGAEVKFVDVESEVFTIAAGQTLTQVPFGGTPGTATTNKVYRYDGQAFQILPVSMRVAVDAAAGDTVTFYLRDGTGSLDPLTLGAADTEASVMYPLRPYYIRTPSTTTPIELFLRYNSGASASTTAKYKLYFTYALVRDLDASGTTNRPIIDVV